MLLKVLYRSKLLQSILWSHSSNNLVHQCDYHCFKLWEIVAFQRRD